MGEEVGEVNNRTANVFFSELRLHTLYAYKAKGLV